MIRYKRVVLLFICVLILNLALVGLAQATGSETPTVSDYEEVVIGADRTFLVKGTVVNSSEVLVYIDGSFIDFADINGSRDGRLSYEYRLDKNITEGEHKFMIIGRDRTSMVLSPPTQEYKFKFQIWPKPAAPTIIYPNNDGRTGNRQMLVTGLTQSGTQVRIYLDDQPIFISDVLKDESGTANFAYRLPAVDLGIHILSVSATNSYGQSSPVKKIRFIAENPLPAPVLVKGQLLGSNSVQLFGLVKNDLQVKVYVDKKLDGVINVNNHKSGVANFAYRVKTGLTDGSHWLYTISVDKNGKESFASNSLVVDVRGGRPSQIAVAPINQAKGPVKAEAEKTKIQPAITPAEKKTETEEPSIFPPVKELPELVKKATGTGEGATGAIDETKQGQNKIKLNLIIFIIFLLAVIGWIFWVNRELIKEKKAQDKELAGKTGKIETEKKL